MVQVIAPLFSLSASGLLGKALLFYDTKYGARVRSPKKTFVPPGSIWEVNIEWFKQASNRWKKDLTQEQKWAWNLAYVGECDTGRDIFMGQQIELWNISPQNDLSWPPKGVSDVGIITFWTNEFVSSLKCGFLEFNKVLIQKYCPNTLWARKLGDSSPPDEDDIVKAIKYFSTSIDFIAGYTNYIWGGVRYYNGTKKMLLVGSYVK